MQTAGDSNHSSTSINSLPHNNITHKLSSGSGSTTLSSKQEADFKGWLYKWTNYIKGYQKRYFILSNGILSYYRSQSDVSHTCRGSINLQGAFIDTVDSTSFVITNGGTQTFHLKSSSEVERQRWVTALELAKAKAIRELESDEEDDGEDLDGVTFSPTGSSSRPSVGTATPTRSGPAHRLAGGTEDTSQASSGGGGLSNLQRALSSKLEDLATCNDLVAKHGTALQKALAELETLEASPENAAKVKAVNERATLFRITANAIMNACSEYLELAQLQNKRWQRVIQHERDQKASLEEMVEQLAKQHSHLEKVAARNMALTSSSSAVAAGAGGPSAVATPAQQYQSPAGASLHHNTPNPSHSNLTPASGPNNPAHYGTASSPIAVSDEDEFFDATDVSAAAAANPVSDEEGFVVTLPKKSKCFHTRSPSGLSSLSEGGPGSQASGGNGTGSEGAGAGGSSESDKEEAETQEATVVMVKDPKKISKKHSNVVVKPDGTVKDNGPPSDKRSSQAEGGAGQELMARQGYSGPQRHSLKSQPPGTVDYTLTIDHALLKELREEKGHLRKRRTSIPPKPNMSLNLWSIIKNCIGKDLSKIPMPVNFSEPLSMLQRLTEDFEYSELLDRAASMEDPTEQMCYVAAFTVSSYATTIFRTSKPFNPLLGETYECDRSDDMGWMMISEQVSHHPPTAAFYTESTEWVCWQEFTMSSKFRGKYLNIIPLGIAHLEFKKSGNHYTWRKVTSTVHNIIVGKLWMEHSGEMDITNHKTKDNCHLKYYSYSYFAREAPRKVLAKEGHSFSVIINGVPSFYPFTQHIVFSIGVYIRIVTGVVTDVSGNAHWVLSGTWDSSIECAKVVDSDTNTKGKPILETLPSNVLWKVKQPPPQNEPMYYFTDFAIQLNEPEPGVAPTDSRLRPDQRLLEEGKYEEANQIKMALEDKQRTVRRKKESEIEQAAMEGRPYQVYEPLWFKKQQDPYTGNLIHLYKGHYFEKKAAQDWSSCPDIYN